jgi:hypothetical protein
VGEPRFTPTPSTAWKRTVSGSISLPSPGCFSPFPHGTVRYRSLRVCSLGEWAPQLHTALHVCGATQAHRERRHTPNPYPTVTVCGDAFQASSGRSGRPLVRRQSHRAGLTTPWSQGLPAWHDHGLGISRFARHYYGNPICSSGYMRCFSSPGTLRTEVRSPPQGRRGCPIRRSWAQSLQAAPPRLSQRCHVLHRHAAPRHPPYAHTVFVAEPASVRTDAKEKDNETWIVKEQAATEDGSGPSPLNRDDDRAGRLAVG